MKTTGAKVDPANYCPKCKSDLRGIAIKEQYRHLYGGKKYHMLTLKIDSVPPRFGCPACGHEWERTI